MATTTIPSLRAWTGTSADGQSIRRRRTRRATRRTYDFGSAHANGLNMAMCDGSVRAISYTIDPTVHLDLANRHNQQIIDANKF